MAKVQRGVHSYNTPRSAWRSKNPQIVDAQRLGCTQEFEDVWDAYVVASGSEAVRWEEGKVGQQDSK